jgi:hypothetical protein
MTGFEVLDVLRRRAETKSTPVIVHTSRSLNPEERRSLSVLSCEVVWKSSPGVLEAYLSEFLKYKGR